MSRVDETKVYILIILEDAIKVNKIFNFSKNGLHYHKIREIVLSLILLMLF